MPNFFRREYAAEFAAGILVFSLAAPLSSAAATASTVASGGRGTVLVSVAGRAVTVRQLTGVGFHDGLSICRRAFHKWGAGSSRHGPFAFAPLDGPWLPRGPHPAEGLYLAGLQGVLRRYFCYLVLRAFIKQYHPNLKPYADLSNLPLAAAIQSRVDDSYFNILADGVVRGWSTSQFVQRYRAAFPFKITIAQCAAFWPNMLAHRAYCYSMARCFYHWDKRRKRSPEWQYRDAFLEMGHIAVGVVMKRDPAKWLNLANARLGSWAGMDVLRAPGGTALFPACEVLIGTIGSPDGTFSTARLRVANEALATLGSPTRLSPDAVNLGDLARTLGFLRRKVVPCVMFPLRQVQASFKPAYISIYQRKTPNFLKGYGTHAEPGGFVFSFAQSAMLGPIARKILAGSAVMPGLKLPSADYIVGWNGNGYISNEDMGYKIPKVILGYPTKDSGWR